MQAAYRVATLSVDWKKAQEKATRTARWAITVCDPFRTLHVRQAKMELVNQIPDAFNKTGYGVSVPRDVGK
jgi:hypothetical protein